MRISELLRASFAGALLFSPAMAEEINAVHDEALRVLRQTLAQPGGAAPSGYGSADADAARSRAEREDRIKAEARLRLLEQERLQAERRRQFEQYVKEREHLRQQQRAYEMNVARQTGQIQGTDDVHAKALEALRQAPQAPAQPQAGPAPLTTSSSTFSAPEIPSATVVETPAAPRLYAMAAEPSELDASSSDVHARALEELRRLQSRSGSPSASAPAPETTPQPSPDLQRRLKEMQVELEQEQLDRGAGRRPVISSNYIKELEERARGSVAGSAPAPAAPAVLDERTRDMIQRQNQEIAARASAAPVVLPQPPVVTPARPPVVSQAPAPAAAPVTVSQVTDHSNVTYSKELEERARQILLERAQVQTAAAAPPAAAVESALAAAQPAPAPAAAPAPSVPDVHSRALETLSQVQSPESVRTLPRTKMERLKEITDLYKADKMTPAEYHQRRAQILAEPN